MENNVPTSGSRAPDFDFLLRVRSNSGVASFAASETSKLEKPIGILIKNCQSLGEAVRSLQLNLEYQAIFHSYQIGQLSEDEFDEQAQTFGYEPNTRSVQELAEKVAALVRWVPDVHFTADDVATIFRVSHDSVEEMMTVISDIDAFAKDELSDQGGVACLPVQWVSASKATSSR